MGITYWLGKLFSPIGRILGGAALLVIFIAAVFVRGRKAGRLSEQARQQRHINKAQERFDEIDRDTPDFDAAAERMRQRSKARRR